MLLILTGEHYQLYIHVLIAWLSYITRSSVLVLDLRCSLPGWFLDECGRNGTENGVCCLSGSGLKRQNYMSKTRMASSKSIVQDVKDKIGNVSRKGFNHVEFGCCMLRSHPCRGCSGQTVRWASMPLELQRGVLVRI